MEQNGTRKGQDEEPQSSAAAPVAGKSPRKRRKVNHACVYCRRSHMTCDLERPCARCIKRNIGHLCHDEQRENDAVTKKKKSQQSQQSNSVEDEETPPEQPQSQASGENGSANPFDQSADQAQENLGSERPSITQSGSLQIVQPSPVSGIQASALNISSNQFIGYSNDWLGSQNQFQDMHNYHPSYTFNAPEVGTEYNLLNDFLNNSLLDDGALMADEGTAFYHDPSSMMPGSLTNAFVAGGNPQAGPMGVTMNQQSLSISRPQSVLPTDKSREYYLEAADPTGDDTPEKRMNRVLRAKYDAGLLKPFNYVSGYTRLSRYIDGHISADSKQKILRQLDRFRPKFRERIEKLKDIQLVYVEMWFEQSLMEYDRVFASMAIPACCWRRTGDIYRGNKEMAELIHVPIEKLREGKIAIYEILTETSLVNYWEKFGAVSFDSKQKALLTTCELKNPLDGSKDPAIECCFSFTIRRDEHNIPALIIGNFLPKNPLVLPP